MYKLFAALGFCAVTLTAQTAPVAPPPPPPPAPPLAYSSFGPIGITAALAGPTANITGAPYSATVETHRVQILADGNRIETSTTGTVARDSQGRVRRDEALPALEGQNGETPHLTLIEDPVAGVHWTLDPRTKTAMKLPFGPFDSAKSSERGKQAEKHDIVIGPGNPPHGANRVFFPWQTMAVKPDAEAQTTDLGTQTIGGVPAKGTRYTRTIPAGKIGNLQPIVITTETWYSPDLKVTLLSKSNDPRVGETTYELTGLDRAEPPASLFEIPPDYTVREGKTNFVLRPDPKAQK